MELRGQATGPAQTAAALNPNSTRQALGATVGTTNKTGGNTFTGQPTAAVKRIVRKAGR